MSRHLKLGSRVVVASILFLSAAPTPAYAAGEAADGSIQEEFREKSGIRGRSSRVYLNGTRRVELPQDLSARPIHAWVQTREGFAYYEGRGAADGTFVVPGVPRGATYALWVNNMYFVGREPKLDLSREFLGRPDAVVPPASTELTFHVDGLRPWRTGDSFQLFSAGSFTPLFNLESSFGTGAPAEGDTRLDGATLDFSTQWMGNLIDATKGDTAIVTRLSAKEAGTKPYQAVTQVFTPGPFTMQPGQATPVTGTFQDVPQTETLFYDYRASSFDAYLADIHPRAVVSTSIAPTLTVSAMPYTLKHGYYAGAIPDVLVEELREGAPVSMTYGNPFPKDWPLVLVHSSYYSVSYSLNGTRPWVTTSNMGTTEALSRFAYQRVEPMMTPVRDIRVDGMSADEDQVLGSLTPILNWSRPAVGNPGDYTVTFIRLAEDGTRTYRHSLIEFRTTERELTVPPGVLVSGATYVVRIRALQEGNVDLGKHPFHQDFPNAYAPAFTGLLRAP